MDQADHQYWTKLLDSGRHSAYAGGEKFDTVVHGGNTHLPSSPLSPLSSGSAAASASVDTATATAATATLSTLDQYILASLLTGLGAFLLIVGSRVPYFDTPSKELDVSKTSLFVIVSCFLSLLFLWNFSSFSRRQ